MAAPRAAEAAEAAATAAAAAPERYKGAEVTTSLQSLLTCLLKQRKSEPDLLAIVMMHCRWSLFWCVVAVALLAAATDALPAERRPRGHPRDAAAATDGPVAPWRAPQRAFLEELRRKRNPMQTVSIKQAEDIGMCKFLVQQDVDPDRIPQIIWTVTCRQTGCRCGSEGDYRCTQLTTEVSVAYRNGAKNQMLYPNSGCICAAKEASDALSAVPQLSDRELMRGRIDVILQQLLFIFNFLLNIETPRTIAVAPGSAPLKE